MHCVSIIKEETLKLKLKQKNKSKLKTVHLYYIVLLEIKAKCMNDDTVKDSKWE